MARIVVDPVTRIEGHLRVDVEVDGGVVKKAWSSAQMFRGIETILKGRDPRDAWIYAQRFCGVCTTVHALASVRSVEDALNIEIPLNAQYLRNVVTATHTLQDHIVHFYHLSALDWVDIVSALSADPAQAAAIAQSISEWPGNTKAAFAAAQSRLKAFVETGKLGIFGTGYWGHPAMKLSPEINLIAFAHYLEALDYQRRASKAVAIIGGKDPHIQNLIVGGVANAINIDNPAAFNFERIAFIRQLVGEVRQFVNQVYLPDLLAIGGQYPEWFNYGAGVVNYLAAPELPTDSLNTSFMESGGFVSSGDLASFKQMNDWKDADFRAKTTESTTHAWYANDYARSPYEGDAAPKYSEWDDEGKYTWCKAPRYDNKPYQVGPLAAILTQYLAGDRECVELVDKTLQQTGLQLRHLHSTLGRHVARGLHAVLHADKALANLDLLTENIASGDQTYANPIGEFPKGEFRGVGIMEAPRGLLSHWIVIQDGKIANYQAVVPSTWNAGPKDEQGEYGPYEASLINNPIADPEKPLEVIRTIHSFDPCIACAVHTIDPSGKEIVKIKVD